MRSCVNELQKQKKSMSCVYVLSYDKKNNPDQEVEWEWTTPFSRSL